MSIEALERRIREAETVLILLTIGAIAASDHVVGVTSSLGPLYMIPLSYSALTHRPSTTVGLAIVCVVLRQWLGPIGLAETPLMVFVRDLGIAALFLVPVVYLHRLGRRRRAFFVQARRQRDDLAREVAMAAALQKRMLSMAAPSDSLDLVARAVPLKGVGGDYYDSIVGNDGRVYVVIADIAGKGLRAAMLMPAVRIGLRAAARQASDLAATVAELNRILWLTTEPASYATLFIAGIDLESGAFEYVSAGHLPGLLLDAEGRSSWLDRGGVPVGLLEGAVYETGRETLAPGGVLVLYTDGVVEAEDETGTAYGQTRLERVVLDARHGSSEALVSAIHADVERFVAGTRPSDDTTVIAIKRPVGALRRDSTSDSS